MADQCLCNVFTRCHCKKSMLPSLHNSLDKVCLQIDKVAMGYAAIIFAVNFVTILCMFFFCAGVLCVLLMVYLMFTSLWILPILYLSWQILDWHTPERGTAPRTWYKKNKSKCSWGHGYQEFPSKFSSNNFWESQLYKFLHIQLQFSLRTIGGRRTAFVRNWRVWKHLKDYFPTKVMRNIVFTYVVKYDCSYFQQKQYIIIHNNGNDIVKIIQIIV